MTILSALHSSRIRNRSMGVLHLIAADESCEVSDILALIGDLANSPSSTSSQPIPQAPAARTYPPVPVAVQAEEAPSSSAETSEASGQTTSDPLRSEVATREDARSDASEDDVDIPAFLNPRPVAGDAQFRDPNDWEDEDGSPAPMTGKSGGGDEAPPAPVKRVTQRDRVRACHEAHPAWGAAEIAEALNLSKANVWSIASQIGIKFASKTKATTEALRKAVEASPAKPQEPVERAGPPTPRAEPKQPPAAKSVDPKRLPKTALYEARAAAAVSLSEPIPPANPQKPIAPPPVGELKTLNERVRALHEQHPNWTGRMIANELGANPNSVSVALARIRNPKAAPTPVEQPQFSGRREMVEHYGAIAKRLGKPS